MSSPENTVVSPLETTENQPPQPPPQKPHSPKSPQQSVTFFLGDEQSDENNNLNNDTSFTEGNTEASEAVETGVLDMSAPWRRSTVECLDSLRLSSGGLVKPSPSAASLDTLHELNDGSNGTTTATASGAAVKSNGGGGSSNGGNTNSHPAVASSSTAEHLMVEQAWDRLKKSYVFYKGQPVGTLAASDPSAEALNYNQVFVRDFFPSALACLMKEPPEADIVKNFLLKTLHLQGCEKKIDNFTLGEGVMPASFKVKYHEKRERVQETLEADYGGTAIGRVAPMDSGFWWIILLNSYVKCTRDYTLVDKPEVQRGIKLILNLCLSDGFDTFPSMLCADDCCMIDRRMGFYGYSMEIQALFFYALRCAKQMLKEGADNKELLDKIFEKMKAFRVQIHSWVDYTQLNTKYRYRTEDLCHNAVNKFNVSLESIPDWLFEFMPNDFIREMSLKISYPDYDPENTSFRGSWLGFLMVNEQLRQSLRTNFNLAKENLKKVNPLCKQSLNKVKPIWIGATNASSLPIGLFSLYSGRSKFDWQHMLEISKKAVKGALVENDNNINQVRRELLDKEKQRIQEMEKELKENRKWHATVTIFGTFIGGLVGAGLGGFIGSRLQ